MAFCKRRSLKVMKEVLTVMVKYGKRWHLKIYIIFKVKALVCFQINLVNYRRKHRDQTFFPEYFLPKCKQNYPLILFDSNSTFQAEESWRYDLIK